MRIAEKALENIRAVMESQEIDWLNSNGFDPVPHKPEPRRPSAPKKPLSGHFSANRFLGTAAESLEPEESENAPVHSLTSESSPYAGDTAPTTSPDSWEESQESEPEFVEVIKQKDNRHSWLYNEVVKAIRDASGDGKNTKVIAIFVPVVQNGKEFEELPVSETIELSPVDEEAVKIEELPVVVEELQEPEAEPAEHVDEIFPEPMHEPDPELAQAFENIEVKPEEDISAEQESQESAALSEPEAESPAEIEELSAPEEHYEPEEEASTEPEGFTDVETDGELDEVPLADIAPLEVQEDEPKQDAVQEIGIEEIAELSDITDIEENPEEFSAGETLQFTEIPMPNELDDEEVFDENKK